ncbi:MAG: hypothetical protein ACRECO_00080 [Xanthobacteraceae bacterium]
MAWFLCGGVGVSRAADGGIVVGRSGAGKRVASKASKSERADDSIRPPQRSEVGNDLY